MKLINILEMTFLFI